MGSDRFRDRFCKTFQNRLCWPTCGHSLSRSLGTVLYVTLERARGFSNVNLFTYLAVEHICASSLTCVFVLGPDLT